MRGIFFPRHTLLAGTIASAIDTVFTHRMKTGAPSGTICISARMSPRGRAQAAERGRLADRLRLRRGVDREPVAARPAGQQPRLVAGERERAAAVRASRRGPSAAVGDREAARAGWASRGARRRRAAAARRGPRGARSASAASGRRGCETSTAPMRAARAGIQPAPVVRAAPGRAPAASPARRRTHGDDLAASRTPSAVRRRVQPPAAGRGAHPHRPEDARGRASGPWQRPRSSRPARARARTRAARVRRLGAAARLAGAAGDEQRQRRGAARAASHHQRYPRRYAVSSGLSLRARVLEPDALEHLVRQRE